MVPKRGPAALPGFFTLSVLSSLLRSAQALTCTETGMTSPSDHGSGRTRLPSPPRMCSMRTQGRLNAGGQQGGMPMYTSTTISFHPQCGDSNEKRTESARDQVQHQLQLGPSCQQYPSNVQTDQPCMYTSVDMKILDLLTRQQNINCSGLIVTADGKVAGQLAPATAQDGDQQPVQMQKIDESATAAVSESAAKTTSKRPVRKTRSRKSSHYDSDDDEFDYPTSKKAAAAVAFEPPIEKRTKSAKKAYIRGKTCRTKGRFCRVCGNKDAIQWRRGPDGRLSYRAFVAQEKQIPVNHNPERISIASLLRSDTKQ